MLLYIDTTERDLINITVKRGKKIIIQKKIITKRYNQAEKLLPTIKELFKNKGIGLNKIKKIKVANSNGSFTSLRIGVATANALSYGLRIPVIGEIGKGKILKTNQQKFSIVNPIYSGEPNITIKKSWVM